MRDLSRCYWIIPSYNESEHLLGVIANLENNFVPKENIIVVDDGSTHGVVVGDSLGDSGTTVLRHIVNLGQGAALQTGIDYAIKQDAQAIVTFDADGQHDVVDALNMFDQLEADASLSCVIGSRFLGTTIDMPQARKVVLKLGILFTYFMTGYRFSDVHNGLRVMRKGFFEEFRFRENRMEHASEILEYLARNPRIFVEAPVTIKYSSYSQEKGQSSMNAINIALKTITSKFFRL